MECHCIRLCVARRARELPRVPHVRPLNDQRADELPPPAFRNLHAPPGPGLAEPVQGPAVQVPKDGSRVLAFAELHCARELDLAALSDVDFLVAGALDVG